MSPPSSDRSPAPDSRPNDFGVWGFFVSECGRLATSVRRQLGNELHLRLVLGDDDRREAVRRGKDVGDVVAVRQIESFGFGTNRLR